MIIIFLMNNWTIKKLSDYKIKDFCIMKPLNVYKRNEKLYFTMHTVHTPCVSVCGSSGLGPTLWTSDAHTFQICFRLKKNKKNKKNRIFFIL